MRPPLLQISSLSVDFKSEAGQKRIIEDLNLQIYPGEAFALVGESGSGKSVTAHSILNLLGNAGKIEQGEIRFDGEAIHTKSQKEMQHIRGKKIGMIFQDPMSSLNPTLKVGWQIAETIVFHEKVSWRAAKTRALDLLEKVGIPDPHARFHAYPFQLSGGMQQRVMIASALSCNPLLLIADEPTTSLDVTIQAEILTLLDQIKTETKMSLLLITHNLAIVCGLCDRIAVMQKGKIVESGDVEAIYSSPQHAYTSDLLLAAKELFTIPKGAYNDSP
jgi:ABC-type dipeptide/oligopeptide/nickel transport system ATPase component